LTARLVIDVESHVLQHAFLMFDLILAKLISLAIIKTQNAFMKFELILAKPHVIGNI